MKRLNLERKISEKISNYLKKPRDMIRKQRVKKRQQSVLGAIRGFLMADSFMYGPLASKKQHGAGDRHIAGGDANSPVTILKDLLAAPGDLLKGAEGQVQKAIDQLEETSEAGGKIMQSTFVSVHKTVTTTTTVVDDESGDLKSSLTDIVHHHPHSVPAKGEPESTEPDADAEEEHSWSHEVHDGVDDFQDHIPLDEAIAEKVANQLIAGFGGRFSDDLGINVNLSDDKVECWFLAANLFTRSTSFEVSKNTYKEFVEAGVSTVTDVLNLPESTLAAILEKTGHTKYGQRVVSQLRKLATHLEENNWGRISTFKHISDGHEVIRQLRSLPGVTLYTARIFVRELRGLWRGVPSEFDMRTKKAAMHLKLLGSIKTSTHPEGVLAEFAQYAGIDLRDLETALFKLGSEHEQQYKECPGGSECTVLQPSEDLLAALPSDILL